MPNIIKLNDIVLEALQSRGYSYTEAKCFIKRLSASKKEITYHKHNNKYRINIFV